MTYQLTKEPPHKINDGRNTTCVTIADEYGGRYHIVEDDHCYVLMCERDGECKPVTHWFYEAVLALLALPPYPDDAPKPSRPRLVS